jgi:hypothetical protein
MLMKNKMLLILGFASFALAASLPASAHEAFGHGVAHYGPARPHLLRAAPRVVIVPRPVVVYRPAYYPPAPVYYARPAPAYYAPAPVYPNWGAVGGAIAGAALGSTIGQGNGRVAAIAAGTVMGAAIGSQLGAPY